MRQFFSRLASAGLLVLVIVAAASARADAVTVFAAASLKNAVDDISAAWKAGGGAPVAASYASSSTLAKQIERGAPADVFISADQQWMDYVVQKGLVGDPHPLLGNRLVLVAPKDSAVKLDIKPGFALAAAIGSGKLSVGDPAHVPAGIYAKEALDKLGVWASVESKLAPGADVRAALALVARGEAPLGIVYETDAKVEPAVRVVAVFPEDSHTPIVYPVAVVKASKSPDAQKFVTYLMGPASGAVFEHYGFKLIK